MISACSPPTIPPPRRSTSGPPTAPIPMKAITVAPFTPFPRPRFPAGVSGGPLVALLALQAGAIALSAIAVLGDGRWPDLRIPGALVLVAAVGHVLLWAGLVAPIRRFGAAMARMATEDRAEVVRRTRIAELDRVARGLYRFRPIGLSRRSSRVRRVVVPLAVAPCLVALLVLGWVVPVAIATVGGAALPPDRRRPCGGRAGRRAGPGTGLRTAWWAHRAGTRGRSADRWCRRRPRHERPADPGDGTAVPVGRGRRLGRPADRDRRSHARTNRSPLRPASHGSCRPTPPGASRSSARRPR